MLIIDDERSVREAFRRTLLLAGFDVIVADGGAEGFQLLGTDSSIRLVLLDLNMPHIDGRQFRIMQRSDARLADVPTVIVTGMQLTADVREELQATGYMGKPVSRSTLLALVGSYCRPMDAALQMHEAHATGPVPKP